MHTLAPDFFKAHTRCWPLPSSSVPNPADRIREQEMKFGLISIAQLEATGDRHDGLITSLPLLHSCQDGHAEGSNLPPVGLVVSTPCSFLFGQGSEELAAGSAGIVLIALDECARAIGIATLEEVVRGGQIFDTNLRQNRLAGNDGSSPLGTYGIQGCRPPSGRRVDNRLWVAAR
jgi:hypothetical protein